MTDAPFNSALYFGPVMHRRLKPKRHRLKYSVFSVLVDLDELDRLDAEIPCFSRNRWNLFSFYDRDFGPGDGSQLRTWVTEHLSEADIHLQGGRIELLCYPRMFGYVFNPLSVYFCYDDHDDLRAILYEVSNTFGERHTYLIPVADPREAVVRQSCPKNFYVSPFIEMQGAYRFRIKKDDRSLAVAITESDPDGPLLHASFTAQRRPMSQRELLRAFISHPLMTLKIVGGIHWEALHLWRKGVRLVDRPAPPSQPVSLHRAGPIDRHAG